MQIYSDSEVNTNQQMGRFNRIQITLGTHGKCSYSLPNYRDGNNILELFSSGCAYVSVGCLHWILTIRINNLALLEYSHGNRKKIFIVSASVCLWLRKLNLSLSSTDAECTWIKYAPASEKVEKIRISYIYLTFNCSL